MKLLLRTVYEKKLTMVLEQIYRENNCRLCPAYDNCNAKKVCVNLRGESWFGYTKPSSKRACFKSLRTWLQR